MVCTTVGDFSIDIKGKLSDDPEWPGNLRENAALFNHTVLSLDPNYLFHIVRDSSGAISAAFTYACLGRLPPVVGPELFSFNLITRSSDYTQAQLEEMIQEAVQLPGVDKLKIDGMKYTTS